MKISAARRAAFDVLWRVETEEAYASHLLASARYEHLSREDHALAQELTLGVLRWQAQLDFLIRHYARRSISRLDREVVIALRLGLYQLNFLTRVPAHAAINESVNLVKERRLQSAAPLANAVLRAAQRAGVAAATNLIQSIKDPLERLSIETSHPDWLLARWVARFGEDEARALTLAKNTTPRPAFRFNLRRAAKVQTLAWLAGHGVRVRDSELVPGAAVVESGSLSAQAEPVVAGWVYVQDEASQLVAHLAADCGLWIADGGLPDQNRQPRDSFSRSWSETQALNPPSAIRHPPLRALDLCAAPGSKTTLMAALLPEGSIIIASDLHLHRLSLMKEISARLGTEAIHPVQLDATKELPFADQPAFDLVLLDAPCSGLGTLQRHPEIKWRLSAVKLEELAALQRRLIENAARQVRPGGLLTYSVCSTEPEEGEEVIASFRSSHPEFREVTRERLTELGLDPATLLTSSYGARTFTHRQGTESFFVCVLWKRR